MAGCLERALLAELMRVIRGALFSWKAGHLKAYLLLCGLGACMHSLELAGGFGGRLVGTVGGLPWRRNFWTGWRASFGVYMLVELRPTVEVHF